MLKKNELDKIVIIYLVLLGVLGQIVDIVLKSGNPKSMLCLFFMALYLCYYLKNLSFQKIDILPVAMFIVFLHGNQYIIDGNNYGIIRCAFILFFVIVSRKRTEWATLFLKYAIPAYLVHIFATIWLKFDSFSYHNFILPLFPDDRESLTAMYQHGQMAGISNHYSTNGMYLACGLILFFALWIHTDNYRKKRRYLFCLFLAVIAVLLTGKRAHALFSLTAIYVVYCGFSANRQRGKWFKMFCVLVGGVAFVYIGQLMFPNLFTFISRFKDTVAQGDISLGRFETWATAWLLFKQNPIFGIGWRRFYELSSVYGAYDFNLNPHNVYIQLLCETGIVGAVIYFSWFIGIYIKTVKLYTRLRKEGSVSQNDERCIAFSFGMQTFFLLYCITGNPLYDAPTFIPYFVACAMTLSYQYKYKNRKTESR